jgi:hypothetical protein
MYTGMVINELMEMVARAEGHVQHLNVAAELEREDQLMGSYFVYGPADSQPLMIGVA